MFRSQASASARSVLPAPRSYGGTLAAVAFACVLVFSAHCAAAAATTAGQTVTVAMFQRIASLDPAHSSLYEPHSIAANVFETLVTVSRNGTVQPAVAESWNVTPDGRRWTFTLHEGRSFHDGSPLNAYAVEYSFQRLMDPAHPQYTPYPDWKRLLFGQVNSIRALDDNTLEIELDNPYAPLLHNLATPGASIVSPRSLQEMHDGRTAIPAGSGPFRVASYSPEAVTLIPAAGHTPPPRCNVRYEYYASSSSALEALLSGRADIVPGLTEQDEKTAQRLGAYTIIRHPQLSVIFLACNGASEKMRSPEIRRAVSLSINRNSLATVVLGANGMPATGLLPPEMWAKDHSLPPYEYAPDKARQLLLRSGYPQGISLTALQLDASRPFMPSPRLFAVTLKYLMAGAGITLSIETLPPDALRERRAQGDYDLFINAWVADTADPDNLYSTHLYAGPDNPLHRVHIPELDRLIEESVSTPVRGERARAYRRIQRIEREQMPCIPVMHSSLPVILRRGISGMRITTGSYLIFRNTVKTAPADRAQQRPAP